MEKKILIIGNGAKEYALAKKLAENNKVFITSVSDTLKEFATCIDIREDNATEILDFVLENSIDLTIPISKNALRTNIVEIFTQNNQAIFSPSFNAFKVVNDKVFAKKLFYKLRIQTPKFGIFEKQNVAVDYLKNLRSPFVIKTEDDNSAVILTDTNVAKNILDYTYIDKNKRVIIEDYIYGVPFYFYAITDGYKALPLSSALIYKYSSEGDGGQLTSGMGACVPNYKLSVENEYFLMDNVIYPILEYLEQEGSPYVGILGVNAVLTEDNNIIVLGCNSFFEDAEAASMIDNIDEDIIKLFESCIVGSFSDEIEYIKLFERAYLSATLYCKNMINKENVISGLGNLDEATIVTYYPEIIKNRYLEYEVQKGPVLNITTSASTIASARNKLYEEIAEVSFEGKSFRDDIGALRKSCF